MWLGKMRLSWSTSSGAFENANSRKQYDLCLRKCDNISAEFMPHKVYICSNATKRVCWIITWMRALEDEIKWQKT